MRHRTVPPAIQGRLKAVYDMTGGLTHAARLAQRARDKALETYGYGSAEYMKQDARFNEANDILHRLHRLLNTRRDALERLYFDK